MKTISLTGKSNTRFLILFCLVPLIVACGGGGGGSDDNSGGGTPPPTITSFDLIDPTPGTGDLFGQNLIILANGNIIVNDIDDSSVAPASGAVHLYDPLTQTLIESIYGDSADDRLGSNGIIALANSNYVIASQSDDVGGIVDAGSVRLMNGTTGIQIGATLAGDVLSDLLGRGSITALVNNNFVIVSFRDDVGGIVDAGSVRLMNGTTGIQIGATLAGDDMSDFFGRGGITALANNNFVIASTADDVGGIVDAGSVRLMNGTTGIQIGATLAGDDMNDFLGSGGITALANNNFVIASPADDVGGIVGAGTVQLVNGATGIQIGATLAGDDTNDLLGRNGITALANNNFVIASPNDDVGGIVDAGSVQLVNGASGIQIGATLAGDDMSDLLGSGGITALANNNFVIASPGDDVGGIVGAGAVQLVNGTSGIQIGATLAGDDSSDLFGSGGITALANNNFVIASPNDDAGGIVGAGAVQLVNGATGIQIGATLAGDVLSDFLGDGGITALANNNFVIASPNDDVGGIVDAGSVQLVNGASGKQVGLSIVGDTSDDMSKMHGIFPLGNNNYLIALRLDDENGIVDAGSVRLMDGLTGAQIGSTITGTVSGDMDTATIIGSTNGEYYILGLDHADNGGLVDSGLVRLIAE